MIRIRFTLILILVFTVLSANSQQYYPLVKDSASWNYVTVNFVIDSEEGDHYSTKRYGLFGDTVINAMHYKKMYEIDCYAQSFDSLSSTYTAAIREDSMKRVYFHIDSADYLQYDFGLNVGDTFHYETPDAICTGDLLVSDIDSVLINGDYRKQYWMEPLVFNNCLTHSWIEGIGSMASLYNYVFPNGTYDKHISCYYENFNLIYDVFFDECCEFTTGIESNDDYTGISVFPNPANDFITIQFDESRNRRIEIYNSQSKSVLIENSADKKVSINLREFSSGFYFLKIIEQDALIERKIVVTNM